MNQETVAVTATLSAKNKKTRIQVIARAASVLRALEHEPAGLSLGAISQRLKLPRSTVQRIVGALEAENLLIAASPTGRVKLGPALLRLSASAETSVSAIAKPFMIEVARDLGETVDLSVMSRDHAIFIEQAVSQRRPDRSTAIAERIPLHCSANGKSMLGLLTDAEIEQKIGRNYPPHTEFTRTTLTALLVDIHEARRTHLAYDLQEYQLGLCSVGVGFRDAAGNRLALSVQMPAARFDELKTRTTERLLQLRELVISHLPSK